MKKRRGVANAPSPSPPPAPDTVDPLYAATERVALRRLAGIETGAEPADALLRRTVCKRLRHHVTLRFALQPVIADRGRGAERFFDVARLQTHIPRTLRVMRPHARQTV